MGRGKWEMKGIDIAGEKMSIGKLEEGREVD